jgi:hypothetical protein
MRNRFEQRVVFEPRKRGGFDRRDAKLLADIPLDPKKVRAASGKDRPFDIGSGRELGLVIELCPLNLINYSILNCARLTSLIIASTKGIIIVDNS